jgi:hypothetical protein
VYLAPKKILPAIKSFLPVSLFHLYGSSKAGGSATALGQRKRPKMVPKSSQSCAKNVYFEKKEQAFNSLLHCTIFKYVVYVCFGQRGSQHSGRLLASSSQG